MAAMSNGERAKAARVYARQVFGSVSANCHHSDILAAVAAFDDAMENTAGNLPGTSGQTVQARLNQALPEPFASSANASQKGLLVAVWAGVKFGTITAGGD